MIPPNPEAGANLKDYAVCELLSGDDEFDLQVVSIGRLCRSFNSIWPSNPTKVDFIGQITTFLNQENHLDPETTLYSIFFGIKHRFFDDHMQAAAQILIQQIRILAKPPNSACSIMVLDVFGRGTVAPLEGELFKQFIFGALHDFHSGLDGSTPRLDSFQGGDAHNGRLRR
ncbi:hypothetical protein BDZ97DRAFT_1918044 [Flammula alnicola]|nr:hypothetical protein BDZ97DRAFT_1918044 [Flammula alnicola]